MSIRFSKHAIVRLRQRFDGAVRDSLLRLLEVRLGANPFPRTAGTEEVVEGMVGFRPVRVIVVAVGSRSFQIVTVMWT